MMKHTFVLRESLVTFQDWLVDYGENKYQDDFRFYRVRDKDGTVAFMAGTSSGTTQLTVVRDGIKHLSVVVEYESANDEFSAFVEGIATAIRERWTAKAKIEVSDPPLPGLDGVKWDDFFDWWYREGRLQYPLLKDLPELIARDYGTIKNRHAEYKAQHGRGPVKK
jgi:hypothetical protein